MSSEVSRVKLISRDVHLRGTSRENLVGLYGTSKWIVRLLQIGTQTLLTRVSIASYELQEYVSFWLYKWF